MLDLFQLFDIAEQAPSDSRFLFLGDYVDRGHSSIETFAYLAFLKVKSPTKYWLLRGNHESREVNQMYGLYNECLSVYGNSGPWYALNEVFDRLPVAAVVADRIICVHGGLSPTITYIDQLLTINRKHEISTEALGMPVTPGIEGTGMVDLTWSDPEDVPRFVPSRRGKGHLFGVSQTTKFLMINRCKFVARSHQLVQAGWEWKHNEKLVTVWSAPNYCYNSGNEACVMHVPGDNPDQVEFWKFDKDENSHIAPGELDFTVGYFA
jgi:diadenosine tetraphosphatase ApaH/serine/threonine PP2A family protein phosphatase